MPGGFGKRGVEGKIMAARYARENKIPYLGICLGMQVALIEYARHMAGLPHANSTEFDPQTEQPVVALINEWQNHDGKVEQRTLDLGEDVDNNWQVLSGAKAGDRLVVDGTQKARPGVAVKTVEVAVDPATGLTVNPTRQADARPAPGTTEQ